MDNGQVIFPDVLKIRITAKMDIQKMPTKMKSMVGGYVPKQVDMVRILDMDVNDVMVKKMVTIDHHTITTLATITTLDTITTVEITTRNPRGIVN